MIFCIELRKTIATIGDSSLVARQPVSRIVRMLRDSHSTGFGRETAVVLQVGRWPGVDRPNLTDTTSGTNENRLQLRASEAVRTPSRKG